MSGDRVDIQHVISAFIAAGAERFVVDLALSLRETGRKVAVIGLSNKTDDVGKKMRDALEDAGVIHRAGPTARVQLKSALWYGKTLTELQPRLVHLHTPNTDLAHYLGRFRWRRSHDLFRTLHNTDIPDLRRYWHAIRRNPVQASIACSSAVEAAMRERVSGPIDVILNGIRFDWPVRSDDTRRQSAERLGLRDDQRHYTSVGRMSGTELSRSAKAQDVLIRAWRQAAMGEAGGVLHLLGDGELRGELEKLADGDASIVIHGVVSNIHDWLVASDSFVMPSRHEGLPIAGIEALATGIPCIFSRIKPLQELAPSSVRWVEVNNVDELAGQLLDSVRAPREYAEAAATEVRERYGIGGVTSRYLACYSKYGTMRLGEEAA